MFEPTNEAETIELYKLAQEQLGWRIVHLQMRFPDAVIENARGQQLVAEFEYLAQNFRQHGHDPAGCDLVICWRNDWPDTPLPVWALSETLSSDHPVFEGWALEKIMKALQEIDRKVKPWYAERETLGISEWEQVRNAFVNTVRPVLEENEQLRTMLDDVSFALAELRGGILITGGKVGEEPQVFIVSHEGWKGGPCEQCGEAIKLRTTDEWPRYCSVDCNLTAVLKEFERFCSG